MPWLDGHFMTFGIATRDVHVVLAMLGMFMVLYVVSQVFFTEVISVPDFSKSMISMSC